MREAVLNWWDETMSTRGNNPKTVCKVVIMQRVHAEDLTGHLLQTGDYHHLCLPAEYEARTHVVHGLPAPETPPVSDPVTSSGAPPGQDPLTAALSQEKNPASPPEPLKPLALAAPVKIATDPEPHDQCEIYADPRTQEGELLCPERFGEKELLELKKSLGSAFAIAGQLQQRPVPRGGALFQSEWFRPLPENLDVASLRIIQMWDLAYSAKESADFTACLTAGLDDKGNVYLLHAWKTRVEELKDYALDDARGLAAALTAHIARMVPTPPLIGIWSGAFQRKLSTQILCVRVMKLLRARGIPVRVISVPESTDKILRAQLPAGMAEMGQVFADVQAPWWPVFLAELLNFPKGKHDDYVDTFSGIAHLSVLLAATERRESPQRLTMGAHAAQVTKAQDRLKGLERFRAERQARQKIIRGTARRLA